MNKTYLELDKSATCLKIKTEMDKQKITIKEMADTLGISHQAVWKFCKGKSLPTLSNLYLIAQILNKGIDELVIGRNCHSK